MCFLLSGGDLGGRVSERLSSFRACSVEPSCPSESSASRRAELEGLEGSAQAALTRLAENQQVRTHGSFPLFVDRSLSPPPLVTVAMCHTAHAQLTEGFRQQSLFTL